MNKQQVIKFGLVFGIAFVLYYCTRPGTSRKPGKESDSSKQKEDAATVGKAYLAAMKAGETPTRLEELNRLTEKEYGLRVYKKHSEGKYYVMDTKGKDVLKIS